DDPALRRTDGAAVSVTVHDSVTSRIAFEDAVAGRSLGNARSRFTVPLSDITPDARGRFLLGFGLDGSGAAQTVAVDRPGVYPVEIGVTGTTPERAPFVTWMIVADPENHDVRPLRLAWIWRLSADPESARGTGSDAALLEQTLPGGRLDDV